ncbi:hypothetical protein NAC44_11545 [Allorhizobium sp. BGMRC 0089]|uniref:hypothetical protein n=1 Tax=Allorhizobium sonneratiae TaxID=2934936 RepID=UPI00203385AA|nr:hypothetical protein [Allorhizobium sonneratiae]MCM2292957.1 hypothetical protein [Allorhizobium sonneratiae]
MNDPAQSGLSVSADGDEYPELLFPFIEIVVFSISFTPAVACEVWLWAKIGHALSHMSYVYFIKTG